MSRENATGKQNDRGLQSGCTVATVVTICAPKRIQMRALKTISKSTRLNTHP